MDVTLRQIIRDDLKERQTRHPNFSMRSYARYLGVNPTSLSLFLNNKRNLSQSSILRILEKLDLGVLGKHKVEEASQFEEISLEDYCRMSDWYYFAILSLIETSDFVSEASWIARRLGITVAVAEEALSTMNQLGVIRFSPEGDIVATGKQYKTPDEIRSFVTKRSHIQALDLAAKSVEEDPGDTTDFSAMTMAIDPDRLEDAKKKIMKFRRDLCSDLEAGKKKEVYRLSIQLFPLTHNELH